METFDFLWFSPNWCVGRTQLCVYDSIWQRSFYNSFNSLILQIVSFFDSYLFFLLWSIIKILLYYQQTQQLMQQIIQIWTRVTKNNSSQPKKENHLHFRKEFPVVCYLYSSLPILWRQSQDQLLLFFLTWCGKFVTSFLFSVDGNYYWKCLDWLGGVCLLCFRLENARNEKEVWWWIDCLVIFRFWWVE